MSFRDDERLRKAERLRERSDFLTTQRKGARWSSRHFIVYARPNGRAYARLGITASGKVGNAVVRKGWKRRLREIFRRNKREFPGGYDFVVIVKASSSQTSPDELDYQKLEEELLEALRRSADKCDA